MSARVSKRVPDTNTRTGSTPSILPSWKSSLLLLLLLLLLGCLVLYDTFTWKNKEKVTTTNNNNCFWCCFDNRKWKGGEWRKKRRKKEEERKSTRHKTEKEKPRVVVVIIIINLEQKTICAQQTWPQQQRKDLRNRSSSIAPDRYVSIASRVSLWRRNPMMMIFYFVAKEALIIAQVVKNARVSAWSFLEWCEA